MTTNPPSFARHETPLSASASWQSLWTIGAPRLGLFIACVVTVVTLAIVYLIFAPRVYEATATVQVEQVEQRTYKSADKDQDGDDDLKSPDIVKTIEQNLQSYDVFAAVVTDPAIANDPDFLVGFKRSGTVPLTSDLVEWLNSNTEIAMRHGTRLIDISVDHRVPLMAQKLAKSIVDHFIQMNDELQNREQQTALKFLVSQSDEVKENLQKSEDELEIYQDSLLLKDRIENQKRVIDTLRQRYRDKHPQLVQARALLGDLMATFDHDYQKAASSSGESSYWASHQAEIAAAAPEDRISTELKMLDARSQVLQKEVETESALFDNILKQMHETDVSRESAVTDIHLEGPPPLPDRPAKPRVFLVLLLSVVAGVALGAAAVALSHGIDSSVQSPGEAEALLGLPVLGSIPRVSSGKKTRVRPSFLSFSPNSSSADPGENELVVSADASSAGAEGFRSLRAVVDLLGKPSEHRSILFTSALPGEGKTFVSCNHALALAKAGYKTLLVDTDLRRPSVHTRFKLQNIIGFLEVVTQDLELNEAVHFRVAKDLNILTAGGKCPNPAEMLAGSGFEDTLRKALANYDRVVFDCSPVNLVSDSLLVAGHVDTVCLVVRAASTSRQAPLHAVTLLRRAHKEPAGIVLNAVPPWHDRIQLGYGGDAMAYRQSYS